ncbi:GumC family protein [Fervidobacterium islandicum]|uniref:GumC family protein n=1 Tax=Fervidobacterium islandicum TaxID=2423 RepID=UPI003A681401
MEDKQIIQTSEEITLSDLFQILRRRIGIIVFVTVITGLITLFYLLFIAKPIYSISATIKIPAKSASGINLGAAAVLLGGSTSAPGVDEQIEIIKSRRVLKNVVNELNLLHYFKSKTKDKAKEELTENQVIEKLYKDIVKASSQKNTSLIQITVELDDKQLAYNIVQSIIKNYIDISKELNKDENSYLYDFVQQQLPIVEKELAEIEEKLQKFQQEKSLVPTEEVKQLVTTYTELDNQIVNAQLNLRAIEETVTLLNKQISEVKGMAVAQSYTPSSEQLEELKKQLAELEIERNSLLLKYTEEAPAVKEVTEKIEVVKKMINAELSRITSAKLETQDPALSELYASLSKAITERESLKATLQGLQKAKEELDKKLEKFPEIQREYVALQREQTIKQQVYATLKAKQEELRLSTAGMNFNVPVVIDEPYIPEKPAKPNKKLTLAVGGVLGIFLGILGAFLREATDQRILDKQQVVSLLGQETIDYTNPFDAKKNSEALKNTLVHTFETSDSNKITHITSAGKIPEKNQIAFELAKLSASLGRRTVLIDTAGELSLNVSKEKAISISKFVSDKSDKNLPEYSENLCIVLKTEDDSDYLTLSPKFKEKLENLNGEFDTIFIITPDVSSAEAKYTAEFSSKNFLVAKPKISTKKDLLTAYTMKELNLLWVSKD